MHFITSKQPWKLTINLVYIKNRGWNTPQGCTFKIFKMVSGTLKLSIPNFTVSIQIDSHFVSKKYISILYQANQKDHLKIYAGADISEDTLEDFTGNSTTVNYTWKLNLVTIHWVPLLSKTFKPAINGTIEMIEEQQLAMCQNT